MKKLTLLSFFILSLCMASMAFAASTKTDFKFCSIEIPEGWVVTTNTETSLTVASEKDSAAVTANILTMDPKFISNLVQDMMKKFKGTDLIEEDGQYSFWGTLDNEPMFITFWEHNGKVVFIMENGKIEGNKVSEAVGDSILFF